MLTNISVMLKCLYEQLFQGKILFPYELHILTDCGPVLSIMLGLGFFASLISSCKLTSFWL